MEHSPLTSPGQLSVSPVPQLEIPITAETADTLKKAPKSSRVLRPGDFLKAVLVTAALAGGMGAAKKAEAGQVEDLLKAVAVTLVNQQMQGSGFQIVIEKLPRGFTASKDVQNFMSSRGFKFLPDGQLQSPTGKKMSFGPATTSVTIQIAGPNSILVNVTSTTHGTQAISFD